MAFARATGQLAERRRVVAEEIERADAAERPAWAPPDPDLIRTLVLLD
jgi:hypothetical protein